MSSVVDSTNSSSPSSAEHEAIMASYRYMCQMPGKQIRGKLARAFNYWLKVPEDFLNQVSEVIQMLHNASLMIDDIEDNSILRRGLPVTHSIYGLPTTLNTANYVYFQALEKVLALDIPNGDGAKIFAEQMRELHLGQGMDIHWRDTVTCPCEDEYIRMVSRKTGGLFMLAIRLMQLRSEVGTDFTPLVHNLGVYFQIRDDYANLASKEYADSKTYCEDLTEGKFSYPIIHAIRCAKEPRILNIVRQRPRELEVKRYCVQLLDSSGSLDYTRQKLREMEMTIVKQVGDLGGNPYMTVILEELGKLYVPQNSE